jgi:hypothetical protein
MPTRMLSSAADCICPQSMRMRVLWSVAQEQDWGSWQPPPQLHMGKLELRTCPGANAGLQPPFLSTKMTESLPQQISIPSSLTHLMGTPPHLPSRGADTHDPGWELTGSLVCSDQLSGSGPHFPLLPEAPMGACLFFIVTSIRLWWCSGMLGFREER